MDLGVLILALNKPYYGRLAVNLASTIRAADKNVPVVLIRSGSATNDLNPQQLRLFTQIIDCPPEFYTFNGKFMPLRVKTLLNKLTPFKKGSLFIDGDSIIFTRHKISNYLNFYSTYDFVPCVSNRYIVSELKASDSIMGWGNCNVVKSHYKLTFDLYSTHSYYFYFANNDRMHDYFSEVNRIHDRLTTGEDKLSFVSWNGQVPDELCFSVAAARKELIPGIYPYMPIYDCSFNPGTGLDTIQNDYIGLSMCGNPAQTISHLLYKINVQESSKRNSMVPVYDWTMKKGKYDFIR